MKNSKTLEERILNLEQRIKQLEDKLVSSQAAPTTVSLSGKVKVQSEKEYLLEKKPADDVQRTFYLGGYLEECKGVESFTVEDLRNAFRSAREPIPSNINDKINKNVAKGYFMESGLKDGKKTWVLTATGEKIVGEAANS